MNQLTQQFSSFLRKKRGTLLAGLLLLTLLLPSLALAQAGKPVVNSVDNGLAAILIPVLQFLRSLLWPILILIGNLLQNDLLFGGGMEERLLSIWTSVRDIVNIFFVLVLIGIALYNVIGGFQEDYQVKTMIPKLIIGLIVVNFSFLGVKVVLDGINVLTTGIFALPSSVQINLDEDFQKRFCEAIYNPNGKGYQIPKEATDGNKNAFCTEDKKLNQSDPSLRTWFNTVNRRNAAIVLALNFEKIDLISNVAVSAQQLEGQKVLINVMFSIVLYIIYASSYVALFVVLLVRLVMLYLMCVLSPLMVLMYVLPEKVKSIISTGEDVAQQFIKHAFVPIPVALYMSIGIILLTGLQNIKFPETSLNASTLGLDFLTSGISTLQELIIAVAAAAFVWKGVFDAMKDTLAGSVTEGIKGFVGDAGKAIGKLPLMAPIFPLQTGGKASILELFTVAKRLPQTVDTKLEDQISRNFGDALKGPESLANEIKTAKDFAKVQDLVRNRPMHRGDPVTQKAMAEFLKKNQDVAKRLQYPAQYAGRPNDFIKALETPGAIDKATMEDFWSKNGVATPVTSPLTPSSGTPPPGSTAAGATAATATAAAGWYSDKAITTAMSGEGVTQDQMDALQNRTQFEKDANLDGAEQNALKQLENTLQNPKRDAAMVKKALENQQAKSALEKLGKQKQAVDQKVKDHQKNVDEYVQVRNDKTLSPQDRIPRFDDILKRELDGTNLDDASPAGKKKAAETLDRLQEFARKFDDAQKAELKKAPNYDKSLLQRVLEHKPSAPAAPSTGAAKPAPAKPKP